MTAVVRSPGPPPHGGRRFPVIKAADLPDRDPSQRWLIEGLWLAEAVGMVGAVPKALKTWIALDAAISVGSGTACLGKYAVRAAGKVLIFCAEDQRHDVKGRLNAICQSRGLALSGIDLHVIDIVQLDLNNQFDFHSLEETVRAEKPILLVLDPFVRIFSGDEDDAGQVSRVLGRLRKLQREYGVAILVVHHFKKSKATGGQALRGSGDLHAWVDSAIYLRKRGEGVSSMSVEHRAAPGLRGVVTLVASPQPHLVAADEVEEPDTPRPSPRRDRDIDREVHDALVAAGQPMGHTQLQAQLKVRGAEITTACARLEKAGRIRRDNRSWVVVPSVVPASLPAFSPRESLEGKAVEGDSVRVQHGHPDADAAPRPNTSATPVTTSPLPQAESAAEQPAGVHTPTSQVDPDVQLAPSSVRDLLRLDLLGVAEVKAIGKHARSGRSADLLAGADRLAQGILAMLGAESPPRSPERMRSLRESLVRDFGRVLTEWSGSA